MLYSALHQFSTAGFNWSVSPAILASSLSVSDGGTSIITESRRLARVSPLLGAYLRTMTGGVLTGEPEAPSSPRPFPSAWPPPPPICGWHAQDCGLERELLHRVMVEGELVILDGGQLCRPMATSRSDDVGPDWNREVAGYKIGKGASVRSAGVFYLGDRRMGDHRAVPWIGPALPFAIPRLLTIRVAAGHGLAALSEDRRRCREHLP